MNHGESFEDAVPVEAGSTLGWNGHYAPPGPIGRSLPHSLEAEEYLLSCCLIDGETVVQRCLEARIRPESFYDPKHGIIFDRLCQMHGQKKPIDVAVLAEELQESRQLEQIGGFAFLTQVSSRLPTTAQAAYFIQKVSEQAKLREVIRSASGLVEDAYAFDGDLDQFLDKARDTVQTIVQAPQVALQKPMEWDELLAFDPKRDPDCLMGNRFLGRTGALIIVAPSGVGKSVLALQLSACAALGIPFFGMQMRQGPLRVLYVQAEDDFGDVAESAQGFCKGFGATKEQVDRLKTNLRIERWADAAGQRYLDRLRATYRRWPFDIVTSNPLFSFCGCNVSEQSELSPFLRNGVNAVLNETRAAGIFVHHTNKPPADPKVQEKAMDAELRYLGSGSAELTNWARAYITLQGVRQAGAHVHKMVFAKRGNRTGIVDEEGHSATSVYIEHAKQGLCWLPSDYRHDQSGKFTPKFDLSVAKRHYDDSKEWSDNEMKIADALNLSPRSVRRYRRDIEG